MEDAELLINIYNASFCDDYVGYGSCPGYGQIKEMMEESIGKYLKHIILCETYTNIRDCIPMLIRFWLRGIFLRFGFWKIIK